MGYVANVVALKVRLRQELSERLVASSKVVMVDPGIKTIRV